MLVECSLKNNLEKVGRQEDLPEVLEDLIGDFAGQKKMTPQEAQELIEKYDDQDQKKEIRKGIKKSVESREYQSLGTKRKRDSREDELLLEREATAKVKQQKK